jgi:hypothetical protein
MQRPFPLSCARSIAMKIMLPFRVKSPRGFIIHPRTLDLRVQAILLCEARHNF